MEFFRNGIIYNFVIFRVFTLTLKREILIPPVYMYVL